MYEHEKRFIFTGHAQHACAVSKREQYSISMAKLVKFNDFISSVEKVTFDNFVLCNVKRNY